MIYDEEVNALLAARRAEENARLHAQMRTINSLVLMIAENMGIDVSVLDPNHPKVNPTPAKLPTKSLNRHKIGLT